MKDVKNSIDSILNNHDKEVIFLEK